MASQQIEDVFDESDHYDASHALFPIELSDDSSRWQNILDQIEEGNKLIEKMIDFIHFSYESLNDAKQQ